MGCGAGPRRSRQDEVEQRQVGAGPGLEKRKFGNREKSEGQGKVVRQGQVGVRERSETGLGRGTGPYRVRAMPLSETGREF